MRVVALLGNDPQIQSQQGCFAFFRKKQTFFQNPLDKRPKMVYNTIENKAERSALTLLQWRSGQYFYFLLQQKE